MLRRASGDKSQRTHNLQSLFVRYKPDMIYVTEKDASHFMTSDNDCLYLMLVSVWCAIALFTQISNDYTSGS